MLAGLKLLTGCGCISSDGLFGAGVIVVCAKSIFDGGSGMSGGGGSGMSGGIITVGGSWMGNTSVVTVGGPGGSPGGGAITGCSDISANGSSMSNSGTSNRWSLCCLPNTK
jgi:hypothetical protein